MKISTIESAGPSGLQKVKQGPKLSPDAKGSFTISLEATEEEVKNERPKRRKVIADSYPRGVGYSSFDLKECCFCCYKIFGADLYFHMPPQRA